MTQVDLYDAAGPTTPALSEEDRRLVERVEEALTADEFLVDELVSSHAKYAGGDAAREKYAGRDETGDAGMLPELDLPGFGKPYTGDDGQIPCGAGIPHVCEGCGHTTEIGRTCRRSTCPRCAPAWAMELAKGHVGRLHEAAKMMSSRKGNRAVYKHHAVVSPPRGLFVDADDPLNAAFHAVRDFLDAIGAEGFVYYHPFSGSDDHQDDRGEWKQRLFQDRDWAGDIRDELEMRPHFHVVCVTPHFPGGDVTAEIHDRTDWVLHRITQRNGSPVSLGDLEDVARAVTYALSHAGIDTRGDGNNRGAFRCYGPAPHDCLPLDEETTAQARFAVHQAAPETLGLSTGEIECRKEVPEDERTDLDEFTPDSDGEGEESSTSSSDDVNVVPCGRGLRSINEADDLLEDDRWVQQAKYAEDAREAKREWENAGGWRGWVEWAEQPDSPPD